MNRRAGLLSLCVLIFVGALTCFPSIGIEGAKTGIALCLETVLPSLFPYMLACDLLFRLVSGARGLPRQAPLLCALFFSFTGGFVLGLSALGSLVSRGLLPRERASRLLAGCVNAGPAFLISGVGVGLFGSAQTGLLLFLSLTLASLVCLALFGLSGSAAKQPPARESAKRPAQAEAGRGLLSLSLSATVRAVAALCGFVVLFSCVGGYLRALLEAMGASEAARWLPLALLEVTGGCRAAAALSGGVYFAAAGVSLCSASILLQLRSLAGSALSLRWLLLSRPLHLGLSLFFVWALSRLGGANPVFSLLGGAAYEPFSFSPLFSALALGLCAAAVAGERLKIAKRGRRGIIKKKARRPE